MYRSMMLGEVDESLIGQEICLAGWVKTVRDHGGIVFIDIRDKSGVVQLKTYDDSLLTSLSRESVISIKGRVVSRDEETVNLSLKSGKVEVEISELKILSKSKNMLPFDIEDSMKTNEEVRLKHRYLDLRNDKMQEMLALRADVAYETRTLLRGLGFTEVNTPILTVPSPEGARDYLVPSRVHKGKFYALPQAPQQFKQLLMCGGVDKYFQIAPCFRDEDPRADRLTGDFYQIDMEMSFATQEEVHSVVEKLVEELFSKHSKFPFNKGPFKKIPYKEAMVKYGTDKPDLRNSIEMVGLEDVFKDTTFGAFKDKTIEGFSVNAKDQPRSFFDKLQDLMLSEGAGGLAWVRVQEDGSLKGPIVKFITEKECEDLKTKTGAKIGDDIFVIADASAKKCYRLAGLLRIEAGEKLGLIDKSRIEFCWIVDFPMFELSDEGKVEFCHNPFNMPNGGLEALNSCDPLEINAYQYDLVANGYEVASGAVRNTDKDVMLKLFEIVGYGEEEIQSRFGALYTAFQYGAPPHAGVAPGFERLLMLMLGITNIRDVVPFPMNSRAQDLLMGGPIEAGEKQLRELHIKLRQ
ncbi:MAG: aspartate--tRNA ligase [Clostridiales bacterium]|nr:aspartate--tRNA ligase [Clostridiales bacterium]